MGALGRAGMTHLVEGLGNPNRPGLDHRHELASNPRALVSSRKRCSQIDAPAPLEVPSASNTGHQMPSAELPEISNHTLDGRGQQ
eukprot:3087162-Alexandrium_andersonii.AAC.1